MKTYQAAACLGALLCGLAGRPAWAGDADIKLTTTNGSTKFTLQNSNGVEVSSVTSLGDAFYNSVSLRTPLSLAGGGTGSSTAAAGLANLGGQPLDATLTAISGYNTNGLLTQTASDVFTGRTLTAGSNKIIITNGNGVSGNPTVDLNQVFSIVSADQTTDTTLAGVSDLSFAVASGSTWSFEMNLQVGSSSTAGCKYALGFPSGTMLATVMGGTSSATGLRIDVIRASDSSVGPYQTRVNGDGVVRITGVFKASASGTVELEQQKVTSGTATLFANSYLVARMH